ncbi:MAG: DMT family transporter [Candidatus Bathyarchaeota archaeon]|jgi:drug/metabolite transporter (DMT)-like permease
MEKGRLVAILEALLVTFLWSSSYVLVKIGLIEIAPLTLVALRYTVASVILVSIALARGGVKILSWGENLTKLAFLGFSGYAIAQGLQVLGLYYLPAMTVTLILNFTPVVALVLGVLFLNETPTRLQIGGMLLVLLGAYFFFNAPLSIQSPLGVVITLLSGVGWAAYLVAGRLFFVKGEIEPLDLTAFSMAIGTLMMAGATLAIEGIPVIAISGLGIILWLGVVNTALAFFLWNHALQRLEAFEISVLQNTMLIQIAILAWVFLGEGLSLGKLFAMVLVFFGALIVQLRR